MKVFKVLLITLDDEETAEGLEELLITNEYISVSEVVVREV